MHAVIPKAKINVRGDMLDVLYYVHAALYVNKNNNDVSHPAINSYELFLFR